MNNFFKVSHNSKKSKARVGEINSDHGKVLTPAFISAATKGTIKTLTPDQVTEIGIQGSCVNTYHLVTHPGAEIIAKAGGIQKYSRLDIFTMSDSGGFQVFSLAKNNRDVGDKFLSQVNSSSEKSSSSNIHSRKNLSPLSQINQQRKAEVRGEEQPMLVKISEDGVKFRSVYDGQLIEFTPEKSMEYQAQIGADINMAFDECTYYPATHEYTEKAMNRTHEWLKRCINYKDSESKFLLHESLTTSQSPRKQKNFSSSSTTIYQPRVTSHQYLYGIIQGGTYEDLRKKSAEFVVSQGTPGVAIGGVSVGESKKEMRDQVKWVSDYLPKDRPVHLLGVGQLDDIVDLVKYGVDTFDCVEPTRLARMGTLYKISSIESQILNNKKDEIDITRTVYKNNLEKVDEDCRCYVCSNFTKSYLHHLFKQREILGYTLATYHNLWVMERLFEKIREMVVSDKI